MQNKRKISLIKYVGGLIGSLFNDSNPSVIKLKSNDNLFMYSYPNTFNRQTIIIINTLDIIKGINKVLIFLLSKLFFFEEYSENKNPDIIDNIAVP